MQHFGTSRDVLIRIPPGDEKANVKLSDDILAALRTRDDVNLLFILVDTLRADRLHAYGLYDRIGDEFFYPTLGAAVKSYADETGVPSRDEGDDQDGDGEGALSRVAEAVSEAAEDEAEAQADKAAVRDEADKRKKAAAVKRHAKKVWRENRRWERRF